MSESPPQPIEVLLVEDDPGDVLMTQEAFADYKIANRLSVVTNGEDAIAYLRKQGRFEGVPTPDLVLLDLNLPRRDGREVLRDIKGDPDLRRIPIVVLTTSEAEDDVLASYDLHANAYVRKPVDFEQFVAAVRSIDDFFITVVRLPPRREGAAGSRPRQDRVAR
ncbi:MAG TPA: response regulator [Acidimicrobiales bacterium]|nr:response regulator [Acidimicrobiales bacterium]